MVSFHSLYDTVVAAIIITVALGSISTLKSNKTQVQRVK